MFPAWLGIREEPLIPRALASAAFDGEGVATRARDLVAAGVLQGYVLSSYSARRLGLETTGNAGGVHNLVVAPNAGGLEEIISNYDRRRELLFTQFREIWQGMSRKDFRKSFKGMLRESLDGGHETAKTSPYLPPPS